MVNSSVVWYWEQRFVRSSSRWCPQQQFSHPITGYLPHLQPLITPIWMWWGLSPMNVRGSKGTRRISISTWREVTESSLKEAATWPEPGGQNQWGLQRKEWRREMCRKGTVCVKTQGVVDTGEWGAVLVAGIWSAAGCMRELEQRTGLRPGGDSYNRGRTLDLTLSVMGTANNKAATRNQRIGMSEKEEGNLWWETEAWEAL